MVAFLQLSNTNKSNKIYYYGSRSSHFSSLSLDRLEFSKQVGAQETPCKQMPSSAMKLVMYLYGKSLLEHKHGYSAQ